MDNKKSIDDIIEASDIAQFISEVMADETKINISSWAWASIRGNKST